MAKNKKKKKEVEKQYGNGIAPISLNNNFNLKNQVKANKKEDKKKKSSAKKVETQKKDIAPVEVKTDEQFTIKTPQMKQRTPEEEKAYQKKQKDDANALGRAAAYTGKKTGLGAVQGLTGLIDAPLQNIQEGVQRGQRKSALENAKNLYLKKKLPGTLGRMPDIMSDVNDILLDPNTEGWQKAVNVGMEVLNDLSPVSNVLEDAGQGTQLLQSLIGRDASKDVKKTREVVNKPAEELEKAVEKDRDKVGKAGQIAGDTGQVVGNMFPSIAASIITGGAGGTAAAAQTASLLTMGVSAKGQATKEAEERGADISQANNIGMVKGLTEVLTEKISGGVKLFGKGSVDDIVEAGLNKYVKNKGLNYLAKQGVGILGENIEEWISDIVGTAIDKATVDPDAKYTFKDWANTGMMTVLSTLALNGITGGYSPSSYINNATELEKSQQTENTQKVIETELQNRLATEFNGKATAREISKLQAEVIEDIKNGYISTDTIEKTLGGETYNQLNKINKERQNIQTQIDELQQKADNNELSSLEEKQKLNDLKEQIKTIDDSEIRKQLNQEIQETIKNDIGLQESYKEIGRRTENYNVDLSKVENEKQKEVYQKAMDSGVLNNSNKTHALVDMIAKISSEKGINFDFTNNEQLEKSGFGVNGRNINGYVTDSGITINLNSAKAINRIVGHELTHTFEGTTLYTELQDSLKDFLGSEWDNQVAKYKDLYKGVKNANIENELTSDLIGDYLFTDENYVKNLSTKNKNLFEKIYDEIKYLYNVATAGSKEKRQLEKVKRTFDRIYNETESKVTTEDAKYSISEDSQGRKLTENQKEYFKNSKVVDDNGNLKVMYNGGGDYTTFDNTKMSDQSKWGKGIYLTEDSDIARMYGDNVKEVYADIKNPINQTEKTISFDKYNKLVQELYDEEADRYDYDVYDNDLDLLWNVTNKGSWADYGEQLRDIVGVDGLIIEDSNPAERMAIAFNSNQIKNVSNKNPTSNADIRFSITKDSKGKNLSEAQQEYFKDSKAVDDDGRLLEVYHGTPNNDFTVFDEEKIGAQTKNKGLYGAGFYFTENNELAKSYDHSADKSGRVMDTYLNITNPFYWNSITTEEQLNKLNKELGLEHKLKWNRTLNQIHSIIPDGLNLGDYGDSVEFSNALKQKGYDGIIYEYDDTTREYVAFNSNQIKNVDNLNPTENDDIRYSLSEDAILVENNEDISNLEMPKSPYQTLRPNVRGGWTIEKIQKQLKNESSNRINSKELSKFDSLDDLMNNIYYHGSISAHDNLKAGSTLQENQRTGGYGEEYHSISLSGNKNIASNFASMGQNGTVMPVILKKDANVIEMPNVEDSIELEDILPELWDKGVDAVKIGDWDIETKGYGEQELVVLNPRAIMTMPQGTTYFQNYHKPKFQNMTKEEVLEALIKTKEKALSDPKLKPELAQQVESRYDKLIKYSKNNEDIRYSVSEDNKGHNIPENLQILMKDSKARDTEGRLKQLYHGTATGEFFTFDKKMENPESDWGKAIYLTDNETDVNNNYEDGGADFDNKIDRLAEQIEQEEDISYDEAKEKARTQLYKGGYKITAYANIKNPAIVGETKLFQYSDEDIAALKGIEREDYDTDEDYDEALWYARSEQIGEDVDSALWEVEKEYDIEYYKDEIMQTLYELAENEEGIEIQELKDKLGERIIDASDEEGRLISNDIARIIIESQGYDGIIDPTVSHKWNMDMEEGTTHYLAFYPNQVKDINNEHPTTSDDIRYSLTKDSKGREQDIAIHYGDLGKARDTNYFSISSGRRSTGHFGNGTYFVSQEEANRLNNDSYFSRKERPYHEIDFSDYNLYKPLIEPEAFRLHDGLKALNYGEYDSFDFRLMKDDLIRNGITEEQINNAINNVEILRDELEKSDYKKQVDADSLSTIFMKELGFDGIDVRGLEGLDNTTYGSVIYDLNNKIKPDIRYDLSIAPISKNFLTEAEQDELDGLRSVENSGWAELTPEESRRMLELENRANTVLNKKAEKMLRSASYKAINTTTKIAQNYLDFDAKEKKSFRTQLREFSNMTKDELVNADTYNKVKDIVSQYANKEVRYVDESIQGIQRELKHTKIKVTDELKNQITDYGYFVKDSKLMLRRNSGQNVDTIYKEYSDMYPGFFDKNVWNEEEQLEALNDFVNHDFSVTEKYRLTDEDLRNATDLIYNKLLDNSLTQQDLIETEEILDKKVQKRTRSVVREELLQKMGITPETIQAGNDISAISFARTDPIRVNEKVFGWETGQKINDATVNFTKHQEAERIRFLNKERQEIKDLGIKARSKESELVQKYGEKQYVDKDNVVHEYGDAELERDVKDYATREKIKNAARVLRQKYDTYIDRLNSVITEMGYDEIPKRKDYMMHFVELDDKFSRWGLPFNKESMNAEDLPTDINGLTEFNKPGRSYFASANARTGLQTTYDAITGIDKYLEGASNWIYHTESIQRYRALTRLIRENYGREHGFDNIDLMTDEELADRIKDIQDNKLSKYVAWLDEQANSIAGKKATIDRSLEKTFGRKVYTALNTLKSQIGSNMTGFNVRSAMTNFASLIQGMSKTQKIGSAEGLVSTVRNIVHDDGLMEKSDFLTSRLLQSESLAVKPWQKLSKAGQVFMEGTDWFTANAIWRGKYYENLHKGMSEQQAIKNADDFAARIMGDRSKGATAELFNSKTWGFLTQFQLEVNNQWSSLVHDNKIDIQKGNKTPLGVTFELGQLFAASYMFNTMMKSLTGSDVMIDPIDMLLKIFKPDDDDKDKGIVERAEEVLGEFINQLPFASMFTGGRIPIGEAFKGGTTLFNKVTGKTDKYGNKIEWEDVGEEFKDSLPYWLLPTGFGQIKKTVKGLSMYDDKLPIAGSYTKSGNLRFSAEDTTLGRVKAGLFGQYSSKYAQDYIESGYKSINASKLDEMKDLDMNSTEYREYRQGLSDAGTSVQDKLDYISSLDVSDEDKTIMASNVAKKDIDMSEYKKYGTYEEFNYAQKNPAKYQVMQYIGGYDTYKNYEKAINEITADYDRNGKAISNSRKNKVISYVNSLNLTKAQKAMLIKEQYPSFTQYDNEIASYVDKQNINFITKASILKQLGFTAYDRQIINYIKQNYRTVEEQQEELEKLGFKVYNYNGKTYVR